MKVLSKRRQPAFFTRAPLWRVWLMRFAPSEPASGTGSTPTGVLNRFRSALDPMTARSRYRVTGRWRRCRSLSTGPWSSRSTHRCAAVSHRDGNTECWRPPRRPPATPQPPAKPRRRSTPPPHVDGLAWSPDAAQLALAVNGEVEIYSCREGRYASDPQIPQREPRAKRDWSTPDSRRETLRRSRRAPDRRRWWMRCSRDQAPPAADTPAKRR